MVVLRSYQQEAVDKTREKLRKDRCALIATCVGSGKSIIISTLVQDYNRAVIVQPAQELVKQNHDKLSATGLDCTMIDGAHKGDWSARYVFTTPQTLSKNLDKLPEPDAVFADEAHYGYVGKMWSGIRKQWKTCKLIGLTATPRYYKTRTTYQGGWMWNVTTCCSLSADIFGAPVLEITREQLEQLGYGRHINMQHVDVPRISETHLADPAVYEPLIKEHLAALGALLNTLDNGLIYCDSKLHATTIVEHSNGKIELLLGTTPKKARAAMIAGFLSGNVKFIATVGCGKIGLDLPNLSSIIILTNVSNPDLLEQMIGRLNRGTCDKTCYYNSKINLKPAVVGNEDWVRIKKIGGRYETKRKKDFAWLFD